MRTYSLIIFFICYYTFAFSQNIKGVVIDRDTKEPLIGVNVIISNTNGTTTDINGNFNLTSTGDDDRIIFKYIGYKTHTTSLTDKTDFLIKMVPESQQIETVVISAGKFEQKIEEITVSMEVIKPSLIENKNTTDIQSAMDQIPGVNITDGQANIRGGSGWSYGAGSRVLVLVEK